MSQVIEVLRTAESIFDDYVTQIEELKISQVSIRRALKKYDVKNFKINNVTPLRAKKMFKTIMPKYLNGASSDKCWLENERRLFIWCTLCYLHKNSIEIGKMVASFLYQQQQDFEYLKSMFPLKEFDLIKFQVNSLIRKNNKNSGWSNEEDSLLRQLVEKQSGKQIQWSYISKQFFNLSGQQFFRNAKQCRERWLNYLDPKKTKGKWQKEQDIILLKQVKQKGKKWSKIVEALQGKKNQHMIKNRYKSLIHKKEKSLRNTKINEVQLIKLILNDYKKAEENIENSSPLSMDDELDSSQQKQRKIYEQMSESDYSDQQYQEEEQQPNKNATRAIIENTLQDKPRKHSEIISNRNNSAFQLFDERKQAKQSRQFAFNEKIEDNQKINTVMINQSELCGKKEDLDFVNNLFHKDDRIRHNILDNLSPCPNIFVASPYAWTPSILFVEEPHPSPLIFPDFSTQSRNFSSFLSDDRRGN